MAQALPWGQETCDQPSTHRPVTLEKSQQLLEPQIPPSDTQGGWPIPAGPSPRGGEEQMTYKHSVENQLSIMSISSLQLQRVCAER